jgi:hypothetical protein
MIIKRGHEVVFFAQDGPWGGLQELTSDISKLLNLKVLTLSIHDKMDSIPEAISCLQELEHLEISYCPLVSRLPAGLRMLGKLVTLEITGCGPIQFPPNLQVRASAWSQLTNLC